MSLTAFNRLRRMKQEEAMKAENIQKAEEKEEVKNDAKFAEDVVEEPKTPEHKEATEGETKTSARRGKRTTN